MSEMQEASPRGRAPRVEATAERRRRRTPGSLNRMVQFTLDCIDPEYLDHANYVYRWVNDEGGRLRSLTFQDDYDHVTLEELGDGADAGMFALESEGRIRQVVGTNKGGQPIHAYLLKKPRAFWEADYEEGVRSREMMMAARVYRGEATEDDERADDENFYATSGNTIGSAAPRRRGPIPRRIK